MGCGPALAGRYVRDVEAAGSSPVTPTLPAMFFSLNVGGLFKNLLIWHILSMSFKVLKTTSFILAVPLIFNADLSSIMLKNKDLQGTELLSFLSITRLLSLRLRLSSGKSTLNPLKALSHLKK